MEAFEAAVGAAAETFDDDMAFNLSGPWPPHNFVQVELDAASGMARRTRIGGGNDALHRSLLTSPVRGLLFVLREVAKAVEDGTAGDERAVMAGPRHAAPVARCRQS